MSAPLAGRGAVITGGGRGIGAAIARALAAEGAAIVVASRTRVELERVVSDLRAAGANAHALSCDVSDENAVTRMGHAAQSAIGHIDILVNNAGASGSTPVAKMTPDEWRSALDVIATGTFLCTRAFLPGMMSRKWGRIVQIASVAGLAGAKYVAHYSAAKHAVIGFTRSLALELTGTGVTANAVCPGYVATPMTENTIENVQKRTKLDHNEALAAVLASAGQSRLLSPEEVAAEIVRLCRDDTGDINGQAIPLHPGA